MSVRVDRTVGVRKTSHICEEKRQGDERRLYGSEERVLIHAHLGGSSSNFFELDLFLLDSGRDGVCRSPFVFYRFVVQTIFGVLFQI